MTLSLTVSILYLFTENLLWLIAYFHVGWKEIIFLHWQKNASNSFQKGTKNKPLTQLCTSESNENGNAYSIFVFLLLENIAYRIDSNSVKWLPAEIFSRGNSGKFTSFPVDYFILIVIDRRTFAHIYSTILELKYYLKSL